jgi:hypothetical protein
MTAQPMLSNLTIGFDLSDTRAHYNGQILLAENPAACCNCKFLECCRAELEATSLTRTGGPGLIDSRLTPIYNVCPSPLLPSLP